MIHIHLLFILRQHSSLQIKFGNHRNSSFRIGPFAILTSTYIARKLICRIGPYLSVPHIKPNLKKKYDGNCWKIFYFP